MNEAERYNTAGARGRAIVISSVSGGGKTSLIGLLVERHPELHVAVTATSRDPREGERHGVDYYFLAPEEFQRRLLQGDFLEHARVHGNHYGIPAAPVEERLNQGLPVILNIDIQGMRTVRARLGHARVITVFLLPPSEAVWEQRLRSRGTDSERDIQFRLEQGRSELKAADEFDYQIVNDRLAQAVEDVEAILRQEGVLDS